MSNMEEFEIEDSVLKKYNSPGGHGFTIPCNRYLDDLDDPGSKGSITAYNQRGFKSRPSGYQELVNMRLEL